MAESGAKMKGWLLAALGSGKKKKLKKVKQKKRQTDFGPLPGEPVKSECLSPVHSVSLISETPSDCLEYSRIPSYLPLDDPSTISVLCISDTHSLESRIPNQQLPKADILIHAGDFSNVGEEKEVENFVQWISDHMERGDFKHAIIIAGNHETTFEPEYFHSDGGGNRFFSEPKEQDCEKIRSFLTKSSLSNLHYLEDDALELFGIRFYGSPWQPYFHNWAFNLSRGNEIQKKWDSIPKDTDVLITHGPPAFHGDSNESGSHTGCLNLLRTVETLAVQYHVFGHIHEAYGVTMQDNLETKFINASICTLNYRPTQLPIMFHIKGKRT